MNKIKQSTNPSSLNFNSVRKGEALPIIGANAELPVPQPAESPSHCMAQRLLRSDYRSNQQHRVRHHSLKTTLSP